MWITQIQISKVAWFIVQLVIQLFKKERKRKSIYTLTIWKIMILYEYPTLES